MLSIEYKSIEKNQTKDKTIICVNDIADEDSFYGGTEHRYAHFYNSDVIDILLSHNFEDVGLHFNQIGFEWELSFWENYLDVDIYCNDYFDKSWPRIIISLVLPRWEHWDKAWSMSTLGNEFKASITKLNNDKILYWQDDEDSVLNGFGVEFLLNDSKQIIDAALDNLFRFWKN